MEYLILLVTYVLVIFVVILFLVRLIILARYIAIGSRTICDFIRILETLRLLGRQWHCEGGNAALPERGWKTRELENDGERPGRRPPGAALGLSPPYWLGECWIG